MAIEPIPLAIVEFAAVSGVVPLPPAPPIATELVLIACAPKPNAVLPVPVAVLDNPSADAHVPASE
ncbi:hypothetical protein AZH11_26585 [Pseudomonas simiae]|nr:hypothetical protein AZH11_26585 [Pseudomonas simiae]